MGIFPKTNQVFDLFVRLEAPDELLDFPVVYTSAKAGIAREHADGPDQGSDHRDHHPR